MDSKSRRKIEERLEKAGDWSVTFSDSGETPYACFSNYSPEGEHIENTFNCDGSIKDLATSVDEYAAFFDPEEHAAMWYETHGSNGAPSSIADLLADANAIKEMLHELARAIEGKPAEAKPEIGTVITISTAHLSKNTIKKMPDHVGLIAYKKEEYGWFLYVGCIFDDQYAEDPDSIPKDITNIAKYAKRFNADIVCIDNDGPIVSGLKVYK